jgi:hypothetical protein
VLCPPEKVKTIQAALAALGAPTWSFEIYHDPGL